jgi:hypothetical protein
VTVAVPDFQSLMLPLLRISADGRERQLAEARLLLAAEFKLSDTDREELLPSGRQSKFANRVARADYRRRPVDPRPGTTSADLQPWTLAKAEGFRHGQAGRRLRV